MTRIALLSDIHGNLPALEAVITDMRQFAPDHVVVAGDMVNCGPFSAEVMQVVYENRWTMIRGNNEHYDISTYAPRRPEAWAHFTLLEWLHDQLGDWHHVIAGLPDDLLLLYPDAPDVHMCHGLPDNCWKGIVSSHFMPDDELLDLLAPARAKTIFCGHTHLPLNRRVGDYHIINPGSVGLSLLNELVASYMILDGTRDGWKVAHHRLLPLNNDALFPAWAKQRFVERGGVMAVMVMEEFRHASPRMHAINAWKRAHYPNENLTMNHCAEFMAQDVVPYILPFFKHPSHPQYLGDE